MRYLVVFFVFLFLPLFLFAGPADDHLVSLGKNYLKKDNIIDAEIEFKKALLINPSNQEAKDYLEKIHLKKIESTLDIFQQEKRSEPRSTALQPWPRGVPFGTNPPSSTGLHPWLPVERGEEEKDKQKRVQKEEVLKEAPPAQRQAGQKPREELQNQASAIYLQALSFYLDKQYEKALKSFQEVQAILLDHRRTTYYLRQIPQDIEREAWLIRGKERITPPKAEMPSVKEAPQATLKEAPQKEVAQAVLGEVPRKILTPKEKVPPLAAEEVLEEGIRPIKLSGEFQTGFGIDTDDEEILWKKANWDLNEFNWRRISSKALDNRANTYDPAIFSQLRFEIDREAKEGWGFHTNIDLSPWSFIGKANKITIGTGGALSDFAEIEPKYWSNTRYAINETYYTSEDGAAINFPEIKVADGKTQPTTARNTWGANLDVPELEIKQEFWPLRELTFDYNSEVVNFRIFPAALEDAAYTSDDLLRLSNNKVYWEESPWLESWAAGHLNTGAADFYKGYWDDSLSSFTRDSRGVRLTNLRGLSFSLNLDYTDLDFTFASPKTLWQDYESFNTYNNAFRLKHLVQDDFGIGTIYTARIGSYNGRRDALNQVLGIDFKKGLSSHSKVSLELASSRSTQDRTSAYKTNKRGNALKFSYLSSSKEEIFDDEYSAILPTQDSKEPFSKMRLELTHMEEGFDAALSNYRETRDDMFWSRHIHFTKPYQRYYVGLYEPGLSWDDVRPFRIGDGIDSGRDVVSLRIEGSNFFAGRFDWLFDARNVHSASNKYLETVSRLESAYRVIPKLTTKFLGIYHDKHDTYGTVDPFVFDPVSGDYYTNTVMPDGCNPSLRTISLGSEYKISERFSAYGIWEHTNDFTLAYDNFPRDTLSDISFDTYAQYGQTYRKKIRFLYNQEDFPLPPYKTFDLFKAGLNFKIFDDLKLGLDWTTNEYKFAGPKDDNMNHLGAEVECRAFEKFILYLKYVYSHWNDINRILGGEENLYKSHHNFFAEFDFVVAPTDAFIIQYGVSASGVAGELIYSPYGGTTPALDTQHITRLYYRKKF